MTADEYVPSEEDWVPTEEEVRHYTRTWLTEGDMDRFLARVRRDAAREALDGLADQFNNWAEPAAEESARIYRDTHYPEENPRD